MAFAACDEIEVVGAMPDGMENTVWVRVVRPEAYILIKAFALEERAKEKDAYDIAFVLNNYQPNLTVLAERVRKLLEADLAGDGFRILQAKFASIGSVGPEWAARVGQEQGDDFEQARRATFENAQELFRGVESGVSFN